MLSVTAGPAACWVGASAAHHWAPVALVSLDFRASEGLSLGEHLNSTSVLFWCNEAFLELYCEPGTKPGYSG